MPTPFTHLEIAQRLLKDPSVAQSMRDLLHAESGAWLLGSVAADARVGSGAPRETTHFYAYRQGITEHPWRIMVQQNPELLQPKDDAHRAFIAGYVAHLSVDELWTKQMVGPHFVVHEWAERQFRFYMLHILLIYMDERDLAQLEPWQPQSLCSATPHHWANFLSDNDLRAWQILIYDQIKPDGESQTLKILGERIQKDPAEIRAFLDSPQQMQEGLWQHIPQSLLHEIETHCYDHARAQLIAYLREAC